MSECINNRLPVTQVWPLAMKLANRAALTPFSIGILGKIHTGAFPPSSAVIGIRFLLAVGAIAEYVLKPPVRSIFAIKGDSQRILPVSRPYPDTICRVPSGKPA